MNARIGRWEVDFFWPRERVVVEIDGRAYHSARTARERDHRKDADLQRARCVVLRVGAGWLLRAEEEVLVEVAGTLARRRDVQLEPQAEVVKRVR